MRWVEFAGWAVNVSDLIWGLGLGFLWFWVGYRFGRRA